MARPSLHGLFEAPPGQVLRAVDHERLRALVDDDARGRALAVLDELGVPVQTVCYECRLARGDARVDVAVAVFARPRTPGDESDGAHALGPLGRRHRGDPAWRRCLAFLDAWSAPGSPLAPRIPFVCVAFDAPDPAALPAPGLSLCVDPDLFARQLGLPAPPPPPIAELAELAASCHDRLHGEPLPAASCAQLALCLADGALAKHLSFMVSRTPAACKLDLRVPIEGVAPLLQRIGWPGPSASVAARIRQLMPWPGHVQLNLVLEPALRPRLEVELLTGRGEVSLDDRLALLRRLVDAGHCDPAKAAVLRDAWAQPVSDRGGVIVARSWYVKVRFEGDRVAEAKAYLGLMPRVWHRLRAAAARAEGV